MGLVVDVPAHELGVGGREGFAHILRLNVAVRTGAIGKAAMPFESWLPLRRSLGIEVRVIHRRRWPDQPGVTRYTVLRGILRPQKTIAHDEKVAG